MERKKKTLTASLVGDHSGSRQEAATGSTIRAGYLSRVSPSALPMQRGGVWKPASHCVLSAQGSQFLASAKATRQTVGQRPELLDDHPASIRWSHPLLLKRQCKGRACNLIKVSLSTHHGIYKLQMPKRKKWGGEKIKPVNND